MKLINAEEYDKKLEAFQLKLMEEAAQYGDNSYARDKRRKLKGVAYARAILRNMESVDAEPVVRCKDCTHAEEHYSETIWCYLRDSCENRDGFCYRGERREEVKKDEIEADHLRREIQAQANPYGKPSIGYDDGLKVLQIIDRQITIPIHEHPVKHGHWKQVTSADSKNWAVHECSECGNEVDMPIDYHDPFCLYCGARMDEVTE